MKLKNELTNQQASQNQIAEITIGSVSGHIMIKGVEKISNQNTGVIIKIQVK
jgi:hypothetical protein